MKAYRLSAAERDTVLAALRLWQVPTVTDCLSSRQHADLMAVATNCNRHALLEMSEVDQLCERINT